MGDVTGGRLGSLVDVEHGIVSREIFVSDEIYRQELRKANALDFDDLLLETVRLLKSVEKVRQHYQRRFQFIPMSR